MSYLSEELNRQMDAHEVNGVQLAESLGCSSSQITRWTSGEQTSISDAQLSAMQACFSDDPHDHARLVMAHLLDEKFGLHHELVELEIQSAAELQDRPRSRSKGERAVEFLAGERHRNRELNDLLIDLARLLGHL